MQHQRSLRGREEERRAAPGGTRPRYAVGGKVAESLFAGHVIECSLYPRSFRSRAVSRQESMTISGDDIFRTRNMNRPIQSEDLGCEDPASSVWKLLMLHGCRKVQKGAEGTVLESSCGYLDPVRRKTKLTLYPSC